MPFCVGVTGGIGSGKSRAASMFGELGADIVDTDDISREITGVGGSAMPEIRSAFGETTIAADGSLDRDAMRQLVFGNPEARARLEHILHPRIRETARHRVIQSTAPYVLLIVPLLLETGAYRDIVRRVLVIDCDETLQVSRTMHRSRLTEDAVRAIMATQMPRSERLNAADDIIRNDGSSAELREQVEKLHQRYLKLAGAAPDSRQ